MVRTRRNEEERARMARAYADAILRDPLGDPREPRAVDRDFSAPRKPPIRLRWIVLGTFIVIGAVILWA